MYENTLSCSQSALKSWRRQNCTNLVGGTLVLLARPALALIRVRVVAGNGLLSRCAAHTRAPYRPRRGWLLLRRFGVLLVPVGSALRGGCGRRVALGGLALCNSRRSAATCRRVADSWRVLRALRVQRLLALLPPLERRQGMALASERRRIFNRCLQRARLDRTARAIHRVVAASQEQYIYVL